jgi:hypothetical protein
MPIVLTSPANGQVLKFNGTNWVNDSDAGITGSGTTNYLPKFTGATTLGNSNVINDGNGNFGFGAVTAPQNYSGYTNIEIGNTNGGVIRLRSIGGTGLCEMANTPSATYIKNIAALPLWFGVNNNEYARIHSTGNFGIGTGASDSGQRLQVTGDALITSSVTAASFIPSGSSIPTNGMYLPSTNRVSISTGGVERMTLSTTNVGFGTASPADTYSYSRALDIQGTTGAGVYMRDSDTPTTNFGFIGYDGTGGGLNLIVNDARNITFATSLSERMRLTAGGNLLIGSTTDTTEKLQVTGTMKVTGASSFGALSTIAYSSAGSSMGLFITNTAASTLSNSSDIWFGTWAGAAIGNIYNARISAISRSAVTAASDLVFYTYNGSGSSAGVLERMRLDNVGNLGLGVTPSAWESVTRAFQIGNSGSLSSNTSDFRTTVGSNLFINAAGTTTYLNTAFASQYLQVSGTHRWLYAASGTAGNAITFTEGMRLDASGNLWLGASTASANNERLQISGNTLITVPAQYTAITSNGGLFIKSGSTSANGVIGLTGNGFILQGKDGASASFPMLLQPYGSNVLIGSTTDSGERLQVTGTAKITGATALGATTITTSNSSALFVNSSAASCFIGMSDSSSNFTYIGSDDGTFLIQTPGNSFSTKFSINSAGNMAVDTNTLFVDATNNRVGIGTLSPAVLLDVVGTGNDSIQYRTSTRSIGIGQVLNEPALFWGSGTPLTFFSGSEQMRLTSTGLGIGMTAAYKLDVTGSARISDAIAIGTTPDTNNPFKILKNINSTVGIRFENTNTSSGAFSAVQLGTDITGGTKFTNLVYSSSGVTQTGVYHPDGTSLINNGAGGVNFLGTPIRFYTGSGNGVVRLYLDSTGLTQLNATAPTTSETDGYRQYSADVVAGNAAPHFRTENGAVIKLYQETTSVGNSIFSQGGGNSVLDDSTFDGYTLRQIVKALRNQGILA